MPCSDIVTLRNEMNDRSVYPLGKRRTLIVFFGLMLGMLLAALDQTIVSTALPRITSDLGGFEHYSWVFSAYMLGATVTVPTGRTGPSTTRNCMRRGGSCSVIS